MTYVIYLFKTFPGSKSFFSIGEIKTVCHCVTVIGVLCMCQNERVWKQLWPISRYYLIIHMKGMRKTKNLSRDSW